MHQDEFVEARAICTEIGIAVLASIGEQRELTFENLVKILQEVKGSKLRLEPEREHSIGLAIKILSSFADERTAAARY